MNSDNKKVLTEASRWIRVGFLTISVLGPAVNALSSRMRERAAVLREEATKRGNVAYSQSQARLATTGTALTNTLDDLKEHPYSKELLKRGSDLAERGSKVSQVVVERSNDAFQELTERSEKASHELARRSEQVSKEITKRGKKVSKEVTKRSQKASRELLKRSQQAQRELAKRTEQLTHQDKQQTSPMLALVGLSMGLTAAGVAAYLLVRKRLEALNQEEQHLHIAQNGHLNGTAKNTASHDTSTINQTAMNSSKSIETPEATAATLIVAEPITEPASEALFADAELEDDEPATEKMPAVSLHGIVKIPTHEVTTPALDVRDEAEARQTSITDATFLGVVGTKHYYPVETPLHNLHSTADAVLDVIYFATEEEAQAQGYTPAE